MLGLAKMNRDCTSDYEIGDSKVNESSFQNSECIKKEKKIKLKLKKQRIYKQKNHGSWSDQEEFRFSQFMIAHRQIFEQKQSRRSNKIFRQMAKYLCSRSSEQCRSHHQKYELRFLEFDKIIDHIKCKIEDNSNRNGLKHHSAIKAEEHEFKYVYAIQHKTEPISQEPSYVCASQANKNKEAPPTIIHPKDNIFEKTKDFTITVKEGKGRQIEIMVNWESFFA